jgi:hypothetical protein
VSLGAQGPRWGSGASPSPSRAWLVVVVAVALLVGVVLGRVLLPAGGSAPAAVVPAGPAPVRDSGGIDQPEPRLVDRVPSRWPRTRQGASAAAAGYAKTLSERWFLTDTGQRRRALAQMAAPEALASLQSSQDATAAAMRRGAFGAALARPGVRALLRTSLLGYRIDRYTATGAQIALWALVVYGTDSGGVLPQALYATSTLGLRWTNDWKLVTATTVAGPVPAPGQGVPTPPADLIRAAEGFKEFGYASLG